MPKWERRALAKKDAERHFDIHQSEQSKTAKRYHKSKHFLGWAVKLLVPDFLIGYPNLYDNLKTLRKHPRFHPLRMALVVWIVFTLTFGGVGIYLLQNLVEVFAATFQDDTQAEFDAGTYSDTQFEDRKSVV